MKNTDKIDILGITLDKVDYEMALGKVEYFLKTEGNKTIVTPNAEIIMQAQSNQKLKNAINNSDMCFPDGIGVVIASKIIGNPLKGRTAGFDLMVKILQKVNQNGMSIYLLGGKPNVAEIAAKKISVMYPKIHISGTHDGYFAQSEEENVVDEINKSGADVVFVAMGAPKQEIFMANQRQNINCKLMMGVGGSLDVISGNTRRAPVFMQKVGLEWLYRLILEPTRIKRMSALPLFLIKVILGNKGK